MEEKGASKEKDRKKVYIDMKMLNTNIFIYI